MITVPIEVLSLIFDYFKNIDLIEASAVCKKWYEVARIKQRYFSKLKESHKIFVDKSWLIKTYEITFDRFSKDMYRDVINYLTIEKLDVLRFEIYQRMYYYILPFRIWSHMWCCCRFQYNLCFVSFAQNY